MAGQPSGGQPSGVVTQGLAGVATVADLAQLLRQLRRRQARQGGETTLTYRELATRTGWSRGIIGEYFAGNVLPPTDRFDVLTRLLGATAGEQGRLATARDRVEEHRRGTPPPKDRLQLPAAVTRLLGRDAETRAVVDLLAGSGSRLVTLTGPGGVGKTRLGLAVAAQLTPHFVDGVAFVSLASVRDPGLVVATIADTLGLRELGARPLGEILHSYLRGRRVLLVLDNAEHLLPAAPQLAALLAAAPRLGLLVTSRSPLRLQGEQVYPVGPLAPSAAIELFAQRAAQAGADPVEIDPEVVGRICLRLDHLPLAIELAAARTRVLPPATLLARLDPVLSVLGRGGPDRPERQQTLRQTVAWSHDLLNPAEQAMFATLAVFTGGWTLSAAAAVAQVDEPTSLELHTGLVDSSLIIREPRVVPPRFEMLDTIRGYATEQLHASGEHGAVRNRHAHYYRDRALAASPTLSGLAQPEILDSLRLEHDNLRAALRRLLDLGAIDDVADVCSRLWPFWTIRGHLAEGQAWADEALATGGTLPATARAKLLLVAGWMRYPRGQYDQAAARLAEAAQLARDIADLTTLYWILPAWAHAEAFRGRPHAAAALFEEAETLSRQLGEVQDTTFAILGKALIAIARGQLTDVDRLLTAHAAQLRAQGAPWTLALTLGFHGRITLHLGEHARTDELLRESVLISARLRDIWAMMHQLTGLANTAALRCDPHRAAMLYGAVDALIERTGATLLPAWQEPSGHCQAAAIAALGPDTFQALRLEGQQLPLDDMIAVATGAGTRPR